MVVPWDGGTTNRPGARHGPRESSKCFFSNKNIPSLLLLKSPYDKFQIADIGDCPINPVDRSVTHLKK